METDTWKEGETSYSEKLQTHHSGDMLFSLLVCSFFSDLYSRVEKSLKVTVMIVQKFLHLSDKITVL